MTIHLPEDVERSIEAVVQSGQFASADEMIAKLVRDYACRHPVQPVLQPTDVKDGEDTPDPFLGLMRDDADLMDEIVADAYRHRREDKWREFDL
jgi:Arc/MetJ-type ribon-helix-helix transcriptional regulator